MLSTEQQTLRRELEDTLEAMNGPGFKYIEEEIEALVAHSKEVASDVCDTNDKWQRHRGELAAYRFVLGMKNNVEIALHDLDTIDRGEEDDGYDV